MWKMQQREGLPGEGQLSPCSPPARPSSLRWKRSVLHPHHTPPSPNSVSSISRAVSKYLQSKIGGQKETETRNGEFEIQTKGNGNFHGIVSTFSVE